ncbi:LAFA_0E21660g1_1 [Lachancea sp. 'fantastica']|nr:LAFA_0E21660g1_1 [Lachancea sp. 'fantastica']
MSPKDSKENIEVHGSSSRLEVGNHADRTQQSRSEKRKSEVLIAAQSLDSELQNVKNLKRISIGSLDMLIDPEMEFRISPTKSQSSRSDESSVESTIESPEDFGENDKALSSSDGDTDDDYSYINDDSIDVTNTEYLESTSDIAVSQSSHTGRTLSGVRRGGLSRGTTSHKSKPSDDSVTQNLLWVPANQHPSVKPENFLELVQDTLHTLKVDSDGTAQRDDGLASSPSNLGISPFSQLRSGSNTLVRRPSGLRKSFTELEDLLQQEVSNDKENKDVSERKINPYRAASKSASLRDLTEELTRISNRAGFTDSDAVSLARTLSMASSSSEQELVTTSKDSHEPQDSEFASSMFMKNGLSIPARSSLRRSKFNTYRIRTPSGDNASQSATGLVLKDDEIKSIPPAAGKLPQSPNSINDFDNIYDHYRQNSLDGSVDFQSPERIARSQHGFSSERGEKPVKPAGDTDSKDLPLYKEQRVFPNEKLEREDETLKRDETKVSRGPISRKKGAWNWFGKKASKDSESSKTIGRKHSNDFVNIEDNDSKDSGWAPEKGNHSRYRHQKIGNDMDKSDIREPSGTSTSTSPSKKASREKKFKQLFKRNRSASISNKGTSGVLETPKGFGGRASDGLRTRSSSADLTNGGAKSKNDDRPLARDWDLSTGGTVSSLAHHVDLTNDANRPLTKLQPSVNVTSKMKPVQTEVTDASETDNQTLPALDTKALNSEFIKSEVEPKPENDNVDDNQEKGDAYTSATLFNATQNDATALTSQSQPDHTAIRNVSERDEDDTANDTSMAVSEMTVDGAHSSITVPAAGGISLPPRRLTFEDVIKPTRPNAPMVFSDSSFGFPLPPLTTSTVVMIDQRLPINVERAIYRLSHLKLGDPKRELRQQVALSNFMYAYLNLVNHSLYLQQLEGETTEILEV